MPRASAREGLLEQQQDHAVDVEQPADATRPRTTTNAAGAEALSAPRAFSDAGSDEGTETEGTETTASQQETETSAGATGGSTEQRESATWNGGDDDGSAVSSDDGVEPGRAPEWPPSFCCPITQELMRDPVLVSPQQS